MKQRLEISRLYKFYSDLAEKRNLTKIEKLLYDEISKKLNIATKHSDIKENDLSKNGPKYINPKDLNKFLLAFNQDPILKYICHEIDDEDHLFHICKLIKTEKFQHKEFVDYAVKRIKELYDKYKINPRVKAFVSGYLTGRGFDKRRVKWGNGFDINWRSDILREWANKNPNLVPHPGKTLINKHQYRGFEIRPVIKSNLYNTKIRDFRELVIEFKNHTHIRPLNSLRKLLEYQIEKNGFNSDINFNLDSIEESRELFTEVQSAVLAFNKIIKICLTAQREYKLEKPEIDISFNAVEANFVFTICHRNSELRKNPDDFKKRLGEQHNWLIAKHINGACNLFLEAQFGESSYRINLWDGNKRNNEKLPSSVQGVSHILIFPI